MTTKLWFRLTDLTSDGIPAWQALGHKNLNAVRHWIRSGISEGWLKPGKHVKHLYPNRSKSAWLVNLANCQEISTNRIRAS